MKRLISLLAVLTLTAPLMFYGCGNDGSTGPAGTSAPATGTLAGKVSDGVVKVNPPTDNTPVALQDVDVWATQVQGGTLASATFKTKTDASGNYSLSLPNGAWFAYMSKQYYTSPGGMSVGIGGGLTTQMNASMSEASSGAPSFSIAAQAGNDFGYGNTIPVAASVNYKGLTDPNDNVSALTYKWTNSTSPQFKKDNTSITFGSVVGGTGATANTATVTFPTIPVAFQSRYEPLRIRPSRDTRFPTSSGSCPSSPTSAEPSV